MTTGRKIIHIDMDCFYAAVEVKYRPELRGKPLGVGGPANSRGVLCTASYEARRFGVRSAMPSSRAVRLCPQLILIPPNFPLYRQESRAVRGILERFTRRIEPLSLDEAYLDVSDCREFGGSATLIAQEIRRLIREELRLTASAGIAPNKFLAKIASDWKKPDGQFVIRPAEVAAFIKQLKVDKIHGVGRVTATKMRGLGLETCGDVQTRTADQMTAWFGSRGFDLWNLAHGVDDRPVETSSERKSLTVEETFRHDLPSVDQWLERVGSLYEDWETRMLRADCADRIRGFVVKAKYHDFKTTTHEMSSRGWPTRRDFENLILHVWEKRPEPIRLLGLGVRLGGEAEPARASPQLTFGL